MIFPDIKINLPNWLVENLWNVMALTGSKIVAFLTLIAVSLTLSTPEFAAFSVFSAITAFVSVFVLLGVTVFIKEKFAEKSVDRVYLDAIGWRYIKFSIILSSAILAGLAYFNPFHYVPAYVYLFLMPSILVATVIAVLNTIDILYSDHRSRFLYHTVAPFLGLILFVLIATRLSLTAVMTMILFSLVTFCVLLVTKRQVYLKVVRLGPELGLFRDDVKKSKNYLIHGVATLMLVSSDRIMLGLISTDYETASYTLAAQFGAALSAIGLVCEAAYSRKVLSTGLRESKDALVISALINFTPLLYLFGGIIMTLIFEVAVASEYQEAKFLIFPIAASFYAVVIYALIVNLLLAEGQGRVLRWVTLFWAVANLVLNYLLLPDYGAVGAASTTFICFFGMTWHLYALASFCGCEMKVFQFATLSLVAVGLATALVITTTKIGMVLIGSLVMMALILSGVGLLQVVRWKKRYG